MQPLVTADVVFLGCLLYPCFVSLFAFALSFDPLFPPFCVVSQGRGLQIEIGYRDD